MEYPRLVEPSTSNNSFPNFTTQTVGLDHVFFLTTNY